jgi:hypothetical protein
MATVGVTSLTVARLSSILNTTAAGSRRPWTRKPSNVLRAIDRLPARCRARLV